jgi:outer membrane protein OmpA-like peptidoglycan-associated protein
MIIMNDDRKKTNEPIKMPKKIGLIVAGLILLYVIVGFWVAPPLLKPKLEELLSSRIGRQVTIAGIKLNPLVLSATISTLTVHEIDGQPFAGFDVLYANSQLSSIVKWALTLSEIRVQGPFGVVKLLPDYKLSIDDILSRLSASPSQPEEKKDAGLPRAIIEKFQVSDGHVVVENLSGNEPIREELSPISFTIDNLSTLEGRQGEYRFTGVGPLGGRFEVDGKITVNPFRVQGSCAINDTRISHYWEHFKELVSFQILSGTTDVSGEYTVEIVDGQLNVRLEDGAFELDDFKLVEKGREEVLIAMPAFAVKGIGADLQAREVNVELVETVDGRIHSWLSPEGTFELQRLLLSEFEKWSKMEKAEALEPAPVQPWQVALKKMEVKDWGLGFEDQTLAHPAKLTVDNIDMVAENLTNAKGKMATLGLSMRFNQAGDVTLKGTAGMVPLQADLNVVTTTLALKSFQPYVDEAVYAQIDSGTTSSKGRLRYRGEDSRPQIRYEGDLSVDDVGIKDRVHIEDFITLAQLKIQGIGLELRPNQLTVAQILIDRPSARVTVDEAGVVNVVNAFTPVEKATSDEDGTDNLLKRLVDFLLVQFKGPMPMSVDHVELKAFSGDFVDASISPSYKTQVEITDATVTGLSSDPSAKADFKFNGRIDGKGRLEGSGQMNPMNALKYSKVNVSLKDFALSPVSPYSGKFIGFNIDQGTLHTELKYQVANNSVDGNNIIVVDQLELGEPVDSPDAIDLPVKLGVALLKDSEGRINVQVPVQGNVKDPQLDFAKAIGSALTGTIEDAGNAPFAAITEVDGFKGEELSTVAFEFGFSELQDREIRKLNALAKLLKEKNALTLGIVGMADRQMDGAVLLDMSTDESPPDEDRGTETEAPEGPAAGQVVDDARLEQLARMRAEQVRTYLIEKANLEARKIQLKPFQINPEPSGEGGFVELSLSVE